MYLKRLELHGFKSFAPRTVLEFSPGITAIVGPNGSGKSNIADGIRWVLGEQSMRQLRGKKSDDVIFAGGQGRATMQMAEVGLVLDNSAAWLPSELAEVSAMRRSFRSGDNEYLVNGQRVRLKDVLLLLAQARIGHDSYTVIGQGLVDQALSLRAEERRGLFEDAAGIRQFQAQRTDAEQKLNLTQTNLARLWDIIGEIEPRLAPLAEQARRAHEFTGAREELTRLLSVWYLRQWHEAQLARQHAESAQQSFEASIKKLQDALAVEDALTQELRQQREQLLAEIAGMRRERGETNGRLQSTEREIAVTHERLASLERQESDLDSEQGQQGETINAARAHIEALEAQAAGAEQQAQTMAAMLDTMERELHVARQKQEREEARLRAAQRDVIQVQARVGAAQTELGRLQKQLGERNRALAARRDAVAQAQRKLDAAKTQLDERRQAFDSARTLVEDLVAQREQLTHELTEGQTEIERLRGSVADVQREQRAVADRLALLEEWQRNLEGFSDGAKALLQADEASRPPFVGVVAQLVSAPQGMELAIEVALGIFLQGIIVVRRDDAERGAAWLRASGAGRAIFLWIDGSENEPLSLDVSDAPQMPSADGERFFGYARDLVICRDELRACLSRALGSIYVVRDFSAVADLERDGMLPAPLVTLTGEQLHPAGWLRGGGNVQPTAAREVQETSILARERELRQLPAEIDRLDNVIAEFQAQFERARVVQEERKGRAESLRKELQRAEARAQELARAVTTLQREQERAQSDVGLSEAVAEQLAAEVQGIEQEVVTTLERVSELEEAQRDATERAEDIQAEVDELLTQGRSQQEELARARTTHAVQVQEVKALAQRADQLRGQMRELELHMHRRGERLRAIQEQRAQLAETVVGQESSVASLRERFRVLSGELRQREERQEELERHALELERGQNAERQELARLEVQYQRAVTETQRAQEAIETLTAQIREELAEGDEHDPLLAIVAGHDAPESLDRIEDAPEAALSSEEVARLRRQIDQLRGRLKHLGGYDPDAPQAYEELKTRYEFLSSQMRDMEQASQNLRAVIAELDNMMRRQFEETFHAVNERFQRHFTTLFSGGAARLELLPPRRAPGNDDDDGEEPRVPARTAGFGGIEVFVQIPGKKVQDLSLLSGGERAMVSAALLFALLETNPPPFCLLDEVDAALDEANVVRFCEILKVLAEQTQFIVITHNRVTMTHANAIYGISMGGDSVSRVLSMRLAEVITAR